MKNGLYISAIVPVYERREMLGECLESIRKQTFAPTEVMVIDDGSEPPVEDTVRKIIPEALYLYQENKGVSAARNAGIRRSSGDLLAFLDSDDLWHPKKLEKQAEFFRNNPDAMLCQTEEIWVRNGRRVNPMKKHKKHSGLIFKECLPLCIISPSAVMIRRELFNEVGLFNEAFPVCEDYELWLRVASRYPIYLIDEPLITKRGGHVDQLSKKFTGMDKYRILAIERAIESGLLNEEDRAAAVKELTRKCLIYSKGCLKHGKKDEGKLFLSKTTSLYPYAVQ